MWWVRSRLGALSPLALLPSSAAPPKSAQEGVRGCESGTIGFIGEDCSALQTSSAAPDMSPKQNPTVCTEPYITLQYPIYCTCFHEDARGCPRACGTQHAQHPTPQPTLAWPFMKVPVVSTAAWQRRVSPKKVDTPVTSSLGPTSTLVTMPGVWGEGSEEALG